MTGGTRADRLGGGLAGLLGPAAGGILRGLLRRLRGAARRARDGIWTLRVAWLRVRGIDAACRALLVAPGPLALRILRAFGAEVGAGTTVRAPLHLLNPGSDLSHLRIGASTWIGPDVLLDLAAPLRIGDRAALSARSSVVTHRNVGASRLGGAYPHVAEPVAIGDDAYLGTAAVVLHGVEVGAGALVAAGAVVRASVPPGCLAAGVPARVVRRVAAEAESS